MDRINGTLVEFCGTTADVAHGGVFCFLFSRLFFLGERNKRRLPVAAVPRGIARLLACPLALSLARSRARPFLVLRHGAQQPHCFLFCVACLGVRLLESGLSAFGFRPLTFPAAACSFAVIRWLRFFFFVFVFFSCVLPRSSTDCVKSPRPMSRCRHALLAVQAAHGRWGLSPWLSMAPLLTTVIDSRYFSCFAHVLSARFVLLVAC